MARGIERMKRLISIVVCLACLAGAGAVWYAYELQLPSPEECDLNQLFHWLVTHDLATSEEQFQIALAERFQSLLGPSDYVDTSDLEELSDEQKKRALRNSYQVAHAWLGHRARQFKALADPDRLPFLDEQIRFLETLVVLGKTNA